MPQSKLTELCSSAAVVPQSKSTEKWSSAAPFHHDLWYFRHGTNEHFSFMLFIWKKLINQPTVAPLKSLKSIHSTKLLEKLTTRAAHTFHWLSLWWFPWNVWNLEVKCKRTSVQTQFIVPGILYHKKSVVWVFNINTSYKEDLPVTVLFYSCLPVEFPINKINDFIWSVVNCLLFNSACTWAGLFKAGLR